MTTLITPRRLLAGVWAATAVHIAGQLLDLRWHTSHPHFETAADQVDAHWLVWIGVIMTLIVAAIGTSRIPSRWYGGYRLLLLAVGFLMVSEAWHFWEHYNHADPPIPHVFLVAGKAAVLAGAVAATVATWRTITSTRQHNGDRDVR